MYRQHWSIEIRRTTWCRWCGFVLSLSLAAPLVARETIVLQKSGTDPQARGADATLTQASPNSNNVGNTLTVASSATSSERAIIEFDLSRIPNVGIKKALLTLHVITPPPLSAGTLTYQAYDVTNFWQSNVVSWDTRVATTAWTTAGGDIAGTATDAGESVTHASTSVAFNVTTDVQNWYNGSTNYGTIIKDKAASDGFSTVFGSKEATVSTNAPELDVTFVQNVTSLTATPGNASVTLNWTIPSPIGTPVGAEHYTGVLILRRAGSPVDKTSYPTDTMDPGLCATVSTGVVVFDDTTGKQTFTDNAINNTCASPNGAPVNGTTYFYKVFLRDSSNYYSAQDITNGSTYTEEISATPAATVAAQQNTQWIAATFATDLASPSLIPGTVAAMGSQTNLVFFINAVTGLREFVPISLGGSIASRSPLIDASISSTGQNIDYLTDQNGLVYAVNTDTGVIDWVVNPLGTGTVALQGAPSVQLKSIAGGSNDQVFFGSRITTTTSANQIFGLNGNTGASLSWSPLTGPISTTNEGSQNLDIMNSTPLIDYLRNVVWITSRSACGTAQPSLWQLNPSTGAVEGIANLGDIDASPILTYGNDVLFLGTVGESIVGGTCTAGNSTIYAINPATGATIASYASTDGPMVSYPIVLNNAPPYTVIFSGTTAVHAISIDTSRPTPVFATVWNTTIATPSAPISAPGLSYVYVGSSDGKIHELMLTTGADIKDEACNTGSTKGTVGDPSIDEVMSRIYVTTTDQRAYAFTIPF
jgi:hypothetical protein